MPFGWVSHCDRSHLTDPALLARNAVIYSAAFIEILETVVSLHGSDHFISTMYEGRCEPFATKNLGYERGQRQRSYRY